MPAPAFIWLARPGGAATTRTSGCCARSRRLPSLLPPSTAMTSNPPGWANGAARVAGSAFSSLRKGMMTETVTVQDS